MFVVLVCPFVHEGVKTKGNKRLAAAAVVAGIFLGNVGTVTVAAAAAAGCLGLGYVT